MCCDHTNMHLKDGSDGFKKLRRATPTRCRTIPCTDRCFLNTPSAYMQAPTTDGVSNLTLGPPPRHGATEPAVTKRHCQQRAFQLQPASGVPGASPEYVLTPYQHSTDVSFATADEALVRKDLAFVHHVLNDRA